METVFKMKRRSKLEMQMDHDFMLTFSINTRPSFKVIWCFFYSGSHIHILYEKLPSTFIFPSIHHRAIWKLLERLKKYLEPKFLTWTTYHDELKRQRKQKYFEKKKKNTKALFWGGFLSLQGSWTQCELV